MDDVEVRNTVHKIITNKQKLTSIAKVAELIGGRAYCFFGYKKQYLDCASFFRELDHKLFNIL